MKQNPQNVRIQYLEVWWFPREVLVNPELEQFRKNVIADAMSIYWECGSEATSTSARQLLTSEKENPKRRNKVERQKSPVRCIVHHGYCSKRTVHRWSSFSITFLGNLLLLLVFSRNIVHFPPLKGIGISLQSTEIVVQSVENLGISWLQEIL